MKKLILILFTVFCVIPGLKSQSVLDSALNHRNSIYSDYYQFQQSMEKRTWINMVNLTTKASEVIKADNTIINYHLYNLLKDNENLSDKIKQLNTELLLVKKESDVTKIILEERRFLFNILLITIALVSLLFLIILILYINRQIRYQGLKSEIQSLYAMQDNNATEIAEAQNTERMKNEIKELKSENQNMVSKISTLTESLQKKEQELETEITSKKQVEEHIRKLIKEIKAYQ